MALTTVPACKAFRGLGSDVTEHDHELARLIPAVQAWLEQECERAFDQATVTEYFDGDEWRRQLLVARPPIASVTNLWDDPARVWATPLAATAYDVKDAEAGLIRLLDGRSFTSGQRNIKLAYVGGYLTAPLDLQQAVIEMVWAAREKGAHNLIGVRSRSIADGNVQFVNLGWESLAEGIIRKYRLRTGVH